MQAPSQFDELLNHLPYVLLVEIVSRLSGVGSRVIPAAGERKGPTYVPSQNIRYADDMKRLLANTVKSQPPTIDASRTYVHLHRSIRPSSSISSSSVRFLSSCTAIIKLLTITASPIQAYARCTTSTFTILVLHRFFVRYRDIIAFHVTTHRIIHVKTVHD